jgi:Fe2+ transport system protein FeoA
MEGGLVPLGSLGAGEIGVVHEVRGRHGFARGRHGFVRGRHGLVSRLSSLGFTPGAKVTMVQNFGRGPIIVMVRGTRIALGRGEAQKVIVTPITEGGE